MIVVRRFLAAPLCLAAIVGLTLSAPAAATVDTSRVVGVLEILWGDPGPGVPESPTVRIQVRTADGEVLRLDSSSPWPRDLYALAGRTVEVQVEDDLGSGARTVRFLRALPSGDTAVEGGIFGNQPWVSILCKFSDVASEPENLAFFQGMYANVAGGLDHYWREQSYDQIDIVGSQAFAWVDLPHTHTTHVPNPGSGTTADLDTLFDHCTAAVDPVVDFSNGGTPFVGINMMFNDLLDCCAWGGGKFATLDGISKTWRVTWNPPWSFANEGVIAHEMGHGFGLPHSNNYDGDGDPYDSRWDMMSSATGSAVNDPVYGNLGKHTLSWQKRQLGWIASGETFVPSVAGTYFVTIDHTALPSTPNYRMALMPALGESPSFTVEVRKRVGSYDGNLPGDAVIITEVDSRPEPAWVYDADVPPANVNNNEGTMWRVGETFVSPPGVIPFEVEVLAETTNGFELKITYQESSLLFDDGFESGNTLDWSSTIP